MSAETQENIYIECPFCKEKDFDLQGLKAHLLDGDCDVFNDTERLHTLRSGGAVD